ncbi:hypothetical protein CCHL11_01166 [Colletotrichum chlorophyti]|uniref:Uncharacterized protein n=1 Tax=Colletotrichum chlorophyti TaxID=708187 RepID=A0A1Q8S872_9PEZI|nr:hypothetical protein CCHL11_01166 [Colletotrichum chlorophyti]
MKSFMTIVLAFVGNAAAQTTTVSVLNPFFGNHSFDASVQDANLAATTYVLGCPNDSTSDQCRADNVGLTLVGGPATAAVYITNSANDVLVVYNGTISGNALEYHSNATTKGKTLMQDNVVISPLTDPTLRSPITVTAGLERLAAQSTVPTATATGSGAAQTGIPPESGQAAPTSTMPNAAVTWKGQKSAWAGALTLAGVMMLWR